MSDGNESRPLGTGGANWGDNLQRSSHSNPYGSHLLPQHAELLRASGIAPDVATERGYRSIETKVKLAQLGFSPTQRNVPGLLIPICDVRGEFATYQYRPDEPRVKDGRPLRYETLARSHMVLDIPKRAREQLRDPNVPLFITEGARKADATVTLGLCCIALLGVWSWRGTNDAGGKTALTDWESIALNGRTVYLAFDSDMMTKREVYGALERFRAFLISRGASVLIVYLPANEDGDKVGLDDYLAAEHSVDDLIALARPELRPPPMGENKSNGFHEEARPLLSIDTAGMLSELMTFVRRYVVITPTQSVAVALWVAHTHVIDAADVTAYLHITSPEMRSGKTLLLGVLKLVVAKPWLTGRVTAAVLQRKIDAEAPTLLLDESDAAFGGNKEYAETLRGLLNTGYERGGVSSLCVGQGANMTYRDFSTFCPKAIAGIGRLPDTIEDRSIRIELKRKHRAEHVEPFRRRKARPLAEALRDLVQTWATANVDPLREAELELPDDLDDRAADVWEPLLAIADLAGGDWPARAREAALALSAGEAREDESIGVRLLADIRSVFDECGAAKLASGELVKALVAIEEAPWGDLRGKAMDARALAGLLKRYRVSPKKLREGGVTWRGYERSAFVDEWARYVATTPQEAEHLEQAEQTPGSDSLDVPDVPHVPSNRGERERACGSPHGSRVDSRMASSTNGRHPSDLRNEQKTYCFALAIERDYPRLGFRQAETILAGADAWWKFVTHADAERVGQAIAALEVLTKAAAS